MYKQSLAALFVMATLAGCASTKVQNPVNYITFRTGGAMFTAMVIAFAIGAPFKSVSCPNLITTGAASH